MPQVPHLPLRARLGRTALCLLALGACSQPDLVIYISLDQEFSQELIRDF